jgi:hypothetical protein
VKRIIAALDERHSQQIYLPFYANFAPYLNHLPSFLRDFAQWVSLYLTPWHNRKFIVRETSSPQRTMPCSALSSDQANALRKVLRTKKTKGKFDPIETRGSCPVKAIVMHSTLHDERASTRSSDLHTQSLSFNDDCPYHTYRRRNSQLA